MKSISILLLASVAAALPAHAQSVEFDIRCYIVSNGLGSQAKNEQTRTLTAMTSAFYLGRIDARLQGAALTAALGAQNKNISGPEAIKALRSCAARAESANARLRAAGIKVIDGK